MALVLTLLIIFSVILFIGMIGEKDKDNRKLITYAFMVCILALVFLISLCS